MDMFRKRSVVWSYFKDIDSSTVQCVICSGFLLRNNRGSTTPMLRHLRLKHPAEVFSSNNGRLSESGVSVDHQDIKVDGEQFCSVEVALEDGDPDTITIVNDAQFSPAISGLLTASHEGPAEQITHTEARDNRPIRHTRRRSLIWRLFEQLDSLDAARCRICTKRLHVSGGISNLRRHLSKRHPKVLSELLASGKQPPADPHHSNADGVLDESFLEQRQGPVEVALEDGNSDIMITLNETDYPVINGLPSSDSAQQETCADVSDKRPTRKRSLIWRYFQRLDSLDAARCRICMRTLQCFEGCATGNLRRHLLNKHPKVFSELVANMQQPPPPSNSTQDSNADGGIDETLVEIPAEVAVEDGDSDIITLNETDDPINNGLPDSMQGHSAQQTTHAEVSGERHERQTHRNSLIWRHFERLDSLNAARCLICTKKLQCFQSGGTSNLHQHLSKRHPKVFSELLSNRKHPSPLNSSQSSNGGTAAEQKQISGELKSSEASIVERRVFNREMELIEALRRTQREEARTLEQQRELLVMLRATGAREAEVERERIESLRKAQQEEAKDLSRQREELEMEKAELQKKWEELQQEREKLLFRGHETC